MRLTLVLALALFSLVGCSIFESTCEDTDRACVANPLLAKGLDGACVRDADCRVGLYCVDQTCQANGLTARGEVCRITAECGDEDYCGSKRECQLAGTIPRGGDCQDTGDCRHGDVCEPPDLSELGVLSFDALAEISGQCSQGGTTEQGETCKTVVDCVAGLHCVDIELEVGMPRRICTSLPASDTEVPALPELWQGSVCPVVAAGDTPQSYFEVPRGGQPLDDFYSLPFPNDIRIKDGHVDLSGHAVAPASFGLPMVERYLDVAQDDLTGFSTNPVVHFRFSHGYDVDTLKCLEQGTCNNMQLVDITPSSPEYNAKGSLAWKTNNISNYVCPVWLPLFRPAREPLRPGTTYAAVLTTGIRPKSGGSYARGADFAAMLGASAPSNSDLKAAYDAYEPLRAWVADTGVNPASILNAAVFTTQKPTEIVPLLREQIIADGVPAVSDLTVCSSASTKSPCEDAAGRGKCNAPNPAFTEIHGRISLPIFQKGKLPYLEPEDGGGIELSGGKPVVQDHQDVCFALSVPIAAPPPGGYPVLVFGHGTGGSFAGEMGATGFAQAVATATVPSALVSIDLPEHGERRGGSKDEPENLFYNFLNPRAARDNVLQGSADLMSVVSWVKQGGISAAASPTALSIAFDPTRIALMGHSQGATHAALAAPYEPDVIGVVLSGVGGHLATSMLNKTMPVDIAKVLPFGLLDPDKMLKLAGDLGNPALAIIQAVFDRADPINYARLLQLEPSTTVPQGHHLFMTFGRGDTFSPEPTQIAYVQAARLTEVGPASPTPALGTSVANPPVMDNVGVGGAPRTIGVRVYSPSNGVDGHFVGVSNGELGRMDVVHFLDRLLAGQQPPIGN